MKNLYAAMAKAFPEIEGASKDSTNPHFKSKYADLSSVVDAIKPALSKHGLWFRQVNHLMDGGVCVETIICHESGEELSCGMLFAPASKNDAQGYGSALTYCRRYSLQTAFGVAPEDDDGNQAVKAKPEARVAPVNQPVPAVVTTFIEKLQDAADQCGEAGMTAYWKANVKAIPADWTQHVIDKASEIKRSVQVADIARAA